MSPAELYHDFDGTVFYVIGPAHGGVFNDTGIICDKVNRLFEMIGAVSKPRGFILQLDSGGTPPAQTANTWGNRYKGLAIVSGNL